MHDTLLRVFVVALGLLTYPWDDPGVEEWDDITTVGMQKHEERLLRGGEKLDHEMAPVSEEMTYADNKGPGDQIPKEHQSSQHDTEKDKMSVLADVTVAKQDSGEDSADYQLPEGGHFITNLDRQQNSESEPETALKTSQIDHKQKGNLQLDMKNKQGEDFQTDGSFRDPSRPQGQHENPEEKEVFSSKEQESPLSHLHTKTSENETSKKAIADWEKDYLWYIWNLFSIISMIRFFRKYLGRYSQKKQEETRAFPVTCTAAEVPLPDSETLQQFHSKCIHTSSGNKWGEDEFLEGFANDLLDAMRSVCDRNGSMVIGDFQMVDVCDIIVPFTPPEPYSFQCLLWNNQASDLLLDMQVCGQIKLVENMKVPNGCHCQSPDADDMVCLLHCETEKVKTKITDVCDGLLCMKNSPFLSKSQVTRWFQSTIKQAWALISHKYEFELNIRYIDAPGALVVRFRSGKKLSFSMNPVVKFTDSHFFITPCSPKNLDTFWPLSLTNYQDSFLEHISKRLPENSCHRQTLEIAYFLHRRQTALSGSSALNDSHFKTALMHLLLMRDPSQWKPNHVSCRLRDLMTFIERSLEKKLLHHVLIGNPLTRNIIELPAEFTQASSVNLFYPLVVHNCIYRNAVLHFQEMLRNAHMLIHDYVDKCCNSANCSM
ncbi:inositol 1,4,5-trisphosphate receptor-interacting protein [Siniperca chuatsi]|uniref:inositol 1,4,5-trisphosphate receptor-interacting protein n=1 Tax=Siniperca chuatsi TaxID=119488 RepID=UPI001CE1154E|nr:inositol 1,4,5-trisphosphate receptor-interacting protein [Siniperca chuatsi]XP_044047432.1 inositol 1,4,5-trisphosphate receptor-interacting protein [Siniperca chuatsi]XP_044047433.1 inositol 1,4,5-trisphosphate receptor-interacting protein [Siniperca chuatsi]